MQQFQEYVTAFNEADANNATAEEYGSFANKFKEIAIDGTSGWLPFYYVALCLAFKAMKDHRKTELDPVLDDAESALNKAQSLPQGNNSETWVVKAMIGLSRATVDPSRLSQTGALISDSLRKAKDMDPANPRAAMLSAQVTYYSIASFGGSKAEGIALAKKAVQLFEEFQPPSDLHPDWGYTQCQAMLKSFTE